MLVYYTYSHTFIHLRCGKNTHVIFLLLNTIIEGMKPLGIFTASDSGASCWDSVI